MVAGPPRRRPRHYSTPKSFKPASMREAFRPTPPVPSERLDSTPLIQTLCQVLDGLKHRASALNTFAPTASAEPEALGLPNLIKLLESFDGQFQALEKALGLAADFTCPLKQCRRRFTRQDSLHRHIRKTARADHARSKELLDQRTCMHCPQAFLTTAGLRRHNRAHHKGLYAFEMLNDSMDLSEQPAEQSFEEVVIKMANGEEYTDLYHHAGSHGSSAQASSSSTSDSSCTMTLESDKIPSCTPVSPLNPQSYSETQPDIDHMSGSSMPNLYHYFTTMKPPFGNIQGLPAESSLHGAPQTSDRANPLSTSDLDYYFDTVVPTIDNTRALPVHSLQTGSDHANPLSTLDFEYYFSTLDPNSASMAGSGFQSSGVQ